MAHTWMQCKGQLLLIVCSDDYTPKKIVDYANSHAEWAFTLGQTSPDRLEIPGVEQTFFNAMARAVVEN